MTSSPHRDLEAITNETSKFGPNLTLWTPQATLEEMKDVAAVLHPDVDAGTREKRVMGLFAKYGGELRVLSTAWTEAGEKAVKEAMSKPAARWARAHANMLPWYAVFVASDRFVSYCTSFEDGEQKGRGEVQAPLTPAQVGDAVRDGPHR